MSALRSIEVAVNIFDCASQSRAQIIALRCSGAGSNLWRKLSSLMGPRFEVIAPNFIESGTGGPVGGARAITLADEANAVLDIIETLDEPVHLVGHSYGGAVALKVAGIRPAAVASLSLYEPASFHILKQLGTRASRELEEIEMIAAAIIAGVMRGAYQRAAAAFVDYWNGPGAWEALRPDVRAGLIRWLPKAPSDFRALLGDDTPLTSIRRVECPVLVMRGEQALGPSRVIAEEIARTVPRGILRVLPEAGHMGPVTHPNEVSERFARHVRHAQPKTSLDC